MKVKGCCSYSDHEMTTLRIPKGLRQKAELHPWASGEQASACLGTRKKTDICVFGSAGIGIGLGKPRPDMGWFWVQQQKKAGWGKHDPTGEEDLVTKSTGMSEVLNPIFISVFRSKTGQKTGVREMYSSLVEKNQCRKHLNWMYWTNCPWDVLGHIQECCEKWLVSLQDCS